MDTTIMATEDSTVLKEMVAMEATEVVVAVVVVEAVAVATTILSNKETIITTTKRTTMAGDQAVSLIIATQITHHTVAAVGAEIRILVTEEVEGDSKVLTEIDLEITTNRKTQASHEAGLPLSTKQKVEAMIHQPVALFLLFLFQIFPQTIMRRS